MMIAVKFLTFYAFKNLGWVPFYIVNKKMKRKKEKIEKYLHSYIRIYKLMLYKCLFKKKISLLSITIVNCHRFCSLELHASMTLEKRKKKKNIFTYVNKTWIMSWNVITNARSDKVLYSNEEVSESEYTCTYAFLYIFVRNAHT